MSASFEKLKMSYDFRSQTEKTIKYCFKSLKYLAGKVWNVVHLKITNAASLEEFSTKFNSWKAEDRPCRVCLTYIHQVGYI